MNVLPRARLSGRLWLFITLALLGALALLGVRLWAQGWFEPGTPIRLYAASGSDLKPGMPVKFRAFKIGTVEQIALKDDAHVEVQVRVENRYLKFIRQTSLARLSKEGLIGNSYISIETSDFAAPPLARNGYLGLMPSTDLEVIARQVKEQVDPVIEQLHVLLLSLNHPQGAFQRSLGDMARFSAGLNDTRQQLDRLLTHSDSLLDRDVRAAVRSSAQALDTVNRDLPTVMRQLNATTQATQAASQSLNQAMQSSATQLPGLIRDSRLLIQQSNDTLDGLRQNWPLKQLSAPPGHDNGEVHGAQD